MVSVVAFDRYLFSVQARTLGIYPTGGSQHSRCMGKPAHFLRRPSCLHRIQILGRRVSSLQLARVLLKADFNVEWRRSYSRFFERLNFNWRFPRLTSRGRHLSFNDLSLHQILVGRTNYRYWSRSISNRRNRVFIYMLIQAIAMCALQLHGLYIAPLVL